MNRYKVVDRRTLQTVLVFAPSANWACHLASAHLYDATIYELQWKDGEQQYVEVTGYPVTGESAGTAPAQGQKRTGTRRATVSEQGQREPMPWEGYGEASEDADVQSVSDLPGMAPFEGEQFKTKELIGTSFVVLKARWMKSTKGKGGHFYAVQAKDPETGELFSTLLGGVAVVKVIDSWLHQEGRRPLLVTLKEVEGGEFGRYYVLE